MCQVKKIIFLLLVILHMFIVIAPVSAAELLQDGLNASLTTSKNSYASGENIQATLKITNIDTIEVKNIDVERLIPDGYRISDGDAYKRVNSLMPGKTITLAVTYTAVTIPVTGDDSNILFWVLLFFMSITGVIWVLLSSKQSRHPFMMLLICITLVCSSSISIPARAAESDAKTFTIVENVSVANRDMKISAIVSYPNEYASSSDYSLGTLSSTRHNLYQHSGDLAVFSVPVEGRLPANEKIAVYDQNGALISYMYDNGEYGDDLANDGVFQCALDLTDYSLRKNTFYASTASQKTNSIDIYIYQPYSTSLETEVSDIQKELNAIESKYTNENGYVPYEKVDAVLEGVGRYAGQLVNNGIAYDYLLNDGCVLINHRGGTCVVYSPKIEGLLAGGNDIKVSVMLPYGSDTLYHSGYTKDSAKLLKNTFTNYQYNNKEYTDKAVSLELIKSFSSNQIIIWYGHGCGHMNHANTEWPICSIIPIGEIYDSSKRDPNSTNYDKEYDQDFIEKRLTVDSRKGLVFSAAYVDKYCGSMNNSVIYLGTCWSGGCTESDRLLPNAFLKKGANAFIGYTEETPQAYATNIMKAFFKYATTKNKNGYYNSLNYAMNLATEEYGRSVQEYRTTDGPFAQTEQLRKPTSPVLYLGDDGDFSLDQLPMSLAGYVKLNVIDESSSTKLSNIKISVKNVNSSKDIIVACPTEDVINNLELTKGEYYFTVSCEGYQSQKIKLTVNGGKTTTHTVKLKTLHRGTLSGVVMRADNSKVIPNACISVKHDGKTDKYYASQDGKYTIQNLPTGNAQIEVSAPGFITLPVTTNIKINEVTYMETFLMVEESTKATGTISGNILDATTCKGVKGAKIVVTPNWNSTNVDNQVISITTTDNGYFSFACAPGYYTLNISYSGYIATSKNVCVIADTTTNLQSIAITPQMDSDTYRFVLNWGANPRDLDSHAYGTLMNGQPFHVYWNNKIAIENNVTVCELDVDDTQGNGKETITLKLNSRDPIYYYVHRYAGDGSIATSNAYVEVYRGNALIQVYNVPTNKGTNDYWNVFAIKNGSLITNNTISDYAKIDY